MTPRTDELMSSIGKALAQAAPTDWRTLTLDLTGAGGMTETTIEAIRADGSVDYECVLGPEGGDACADLRDAMYQKGKGTWYNATFTLDADLRLDADFDYDNPPFDGNADDELLLDDQREFPRDEENLPAWHPSRRS